jgi:rifampicin phosphotransferase
VVLEWRGQLLKLPTCLALEDAAGTTALVGGKAARLGDLLALGLPVPRGFVLTPAALAEVAKRAGLVPLLQRADSQLRTGDSALARAAGQEAAAALCGITFSDTLRETIAKQHSLLLAGPLLHGEEDDHEPLLAVRSSALGEDGLQHSHAGQYSSLLNLKSLESVLAAVREVWASWFSDRAVGYRLHCLSERGGLLFGGADQGDLPRGLPAMSVIVQRMVAPRCSGMLFTAHPVTGNRDELTLEAGPGLGEALAQGRLHPDFFVVRRPVARAARPVIVERSIALKARALRAQPRGSGQLRFEPVPVSEQQQPALTNSEVIELCRLALRAEDRLGGPVDVEWAIDSRDRIRLLQLRPITALARRGQHKAAKPSAPLRERPVLWTQRFSGERWTEGATTLGWSLVQPVLHHFTFWEDASDRWLSGTEPSRLIRGRPYFNLTIFRHLAFRLPGGAPPQFLLEMFPPQEQEELKKKAPFLPNLSLVGSVLGQAVRERRWERYRYNLWTNYEEWEAFRPEFEASIEALAMDFTEVGEGLEVLSKARELMVSYLSIHLLSLLYAHLSYEALDKALRSWGGIGGEAIRAALVSEPGENETLQCNFALWKLAQQAQQMDTVRERLIRAPLPELSDLESLEGGAEFAASFEEFLASFGHRSSASWEVFASRWEDSPEIPLQMLAGYLRGGLPEDPTLGAQRRNEERTQAERLVRTRMSRTWLRRLVPWRQSVFEGLLALCRRYISLRENQRFSFDRLLLRMKRLLERMGALLERGGLLESGEDIVFLEVDEVIGLHEGTLSSAQAASVIESRRQQFERDLYSSHPDFLSGELPVDQVDRVMSSDEDWVLSGLGISSGRTRGRVAVLHSLADMAKLEPGDILVIRAADPGWTPLFLTAGALVLELGSVLSHGAVVAREYQLPAVVNVQGACGFLRDGMEVTVDGDLGTVTVHRARKGPLDQERDLNDGRCDV